MDTGLIKMRAVIDRDKILRILEGTWEDDPDRVELYRVLCKVIEDFLEAIIVGSDELRIIALRLEATERANHYIVMYINK